MSEDKYSNFIKQLAEEEAQGDSASLSTHQERAVDVALSLLNTMRTKTPTYIKIYKALNSVIQDLPEMERPDKEAITNSIMTLCGDRIINEVEQMDGETYFSKNLRNLEEGWKGGMK